MPKLHLNYACLITFKYVSIVHTSQIGLKLSIRYLESSGVISKILLRNFIKPLIKVENIFYLAFRLHRVKRLSFAY